MGSANCKEYVTTPPNKTGACTNSSNGTYQSTSDAEMDMEYTELVTICKVTDIEENQMKQFNFDSNTRVLVVKQNGVITAIGNKCPHYGAPLHTGALGLGRVRCPWHGAVFDTVTGDVEDYPGLDALPCYMVRIEPNGEVKLRGKRIDLEKNKRLKDMVLREPSNEHCIVVVGGGPAGGVCVETLRQEGFSGRIVLLCREQYRPYDRIKISKTMHTSIAALEFRPQSFYDKYDIEVLLGVEATGVDTDQKLVACSNGMSIKYDQLFLATGSRPRKVPVKGHQLRNVVTVRDYTDAQYIVENVTEESHVVCFGSSFIALEVAAYLKGKVKSVTIVGRTNVPFQQVLGEEIGKRFVDLFEEKGIHMIMNNTVMEIFGNAEGKVVKLELLNQQKILCDLFVMGTGSDFNTEFLKDSKVKVNKNAAIDVDMHLMTNIIDVYAGGDIANAPVLSFDNQRQTIGHYQLAQYHGRVAALNMTGKIEDLRAVPFFFTSIFGKSLRFAGFNDGFSEVLIHGDLKEFKFIAYYLDAHGNVMATASIGADPVVAQFAELQSQGKRLHRSDIEDKEDPLEWTNMLKEQKARMRCPC